MYKLQFEDIIVGTLEIIDRDFPWLYCKFSPTEQFQKVKHDFERFESIQGNMEDEESDRIWFEFNKKYHIVNQKRERVEMAIVWIEDGIISIRPMDTKIFSKPYEEAFND